MSVMTNDADSVNITRVETATTDCVVVTDDEDLPKSYCFLFLGINTFCIFIVICDYAYKFTYM